MECPNCGVINIPGTQTCECGYDFRGGSSAPPKWIRTVREHQGAIGYAALVLIGAYVAALVNFPVPTISLTVVCIFVFVVLVLLLRVGLSQGPFPSAPWIYPLARPLYGLFVIVSRPLVSAHSYAQFCKRRYEWDGERIARSLENLSDATAKRLRQLSASEVADRIRSFVEKTSRVNTYSTCATVSSLANDDSPPAISWRAEVVRPNRIHVRQVAGQDYDEWTSIDDRTWESIILMISGPDASNSFHSIRSKVNKRLFIDRFMIIISQASPTTAQMRRSGGSEFVHLVWDNIDGHLVALFLSEEETDITEGEILSGRMEIWLRGDLLAKAELLVKATAFAQTFYLYNEAIEILDPRGIPADPTN